jgi:hypothetical protein
VFGDGLLDQLITRRNERMIKTHTIFKGESEGVLWHHRENKKESAK